MSKHPVETAQNKLDLSGQLLKKIAKLPGDSASLVTELHLDNNELHKLENLSQFSSVVEFSATHNHLSRMYNVAPLHHIVRLDLSYNTITHMEGFRDLVHLTYLNLSNNRIKVIDQLSTNLLIEHLDLSENLITQITNLSQLFKLKKLYLQKNLIASLKTCDVHLPRNLMTLNLAGNKLTDLTEFTFLSTITGLKELSVVSNPCVDMTGKSVGFDYRPYLVNWCNNLTVIDGYAVDEIESLKGEWLYSQGRGRQFRSGQHAELVEYLVETCPISCAKMQTETERKLRLVLSKAHQHQNQLRMSESMNPEGSGSIKSFSELMSRSLDPSLLDNMRERKSCNSTSDTSFTRSMLCDLETKPLETQLPKAATVTTNPLPAATKLVPVPESLISPMVTNTPPLLLNEGLPEADQVSESKLQTIRNTAQLIRESRMSNGGEEEQAAIRIQKMWRGYRTRHLNPKLSTVYQHLNAQRTQRFIKKLSEDMEATRAALDSEHKLQLLQMQAINALWKKVVSLQPTEVGGGNIGEVKDLAQTCQRLNNQVQQLQNSMQEVLRCVSPSTGHQVGTQTDISAVHSPINELISRPSTLPLPQQLTDSTENPGEETTRDESAHPANPEK